MSGLSERLRPDTFDDFVGQEHLVGPGALLRVSIERDELFSAILHGPPGTGKSSLLKLIKRYTTYETVHLNGALVTVDEIKSWERYALNFRGLKRVLLFIDEIHRLNKKQQDVFLPGVETGLYVLMGTTTESPQHTINPALLSRCKVLRFTKLSERHLQKILSRAIAITGVDVSEEVRRYLLSSSNGDARFMLGTYELMVGICSAYGKGIVDDEVLELYGADARYEYTDSEHYNLASAFIKSIRGSDPDAALYYMARMLNGGEDPRFIARRLVILASEDVGLADPFALVLAVSTMQAVEMVGMPECKINLAQCVVYLSLAPKSNSSYTAIAKAEEVAKKTMNVPIPRHLLNVEDSGYMYPHDYGGFVRQSYMPLQVKERFYEPKPIAKEAKLAEIYRKLWNGAGSDGSGERGSR